MSSPVRVVLSTFPSLQVADEVARALVTERHAACVNIMPQGRSVYRWKGEVQSEAEVLAIVKTTESALASCRRRLVELHPYECPEVIALPVCDGHPAYLAWVADETTDQ